MTERSAGRATSAAPGLARTAMGLALLIGADGIVTTVHQGRPLKGSVPLARALGLRDMVQGALLAAWPHPAVRRLGLTIDLLHLATMLPVVADARTRRLGLAALAEASVGALCTVTARAR